MDLKLFGTGGFCVGLEIGNFVPLGWGKYWLNSRALKWMGIHPFRGGLELETPDIRFRTVRDGFLVLVFGFEKKIFSEPPMLRGNIAFG